MFKSAVSKTAVFLFCFTASLLHDCIQRPYKLWKLGGCYVQLKVTLCVTGVNGFPFRCRVRPNCCCFLLHCSGISPKLGQGKGSDTDAVSIASDLSRNKGFESSTLQKGKDMGFYIGRRWLRPLCAMQCDQVQGDDITW